MNDGPTDTSVSDPSGPALVAEFDTDTPVLGGAAALALLDLLLASKDVPRGEATNDGPRPTGKP